MKVWKPIAVVLLAGLVAVLVYPGIPIGGAMLSQNTASGRSSTLTCYSLHWNGVRTRVIDLGDAPNVSNAPCYSSR